MQARNFSVTIVMGLLAINMRYKTLASLRWLLIGYLVCGQAEGFCADEIGSGVATQDAALLLRNRTPPDEIPSGKLPKFPALTLTQPLNAPVSADKSKQPEISLAVITVYGTIDSEAIQTMEKSPITKMRDILDKSGKSHMPMFVESTAANGSRAVRITTSVRNY